MGVEALYSCWCPARPSFLGWCTHLPDLPQRPADSLRQSPQGDKPGRLAGHHWCRGVKAQPLLSVTTSAGQFSLQGSHWGQAGFPR